MAYDTSLCFNPGDHRWMFRRKNGTWKTRQWRKAMKAYNRCVAGALSSPQQLADSIGSSASDIVDSVMGGGGDRPVYVPEYSQGGGPSGGEEFLDTEVAGIPAPYLLGGIGILALMMWSK